MLKNVRYRQARNSGKRGLAIPVDTRIIVCKVGLAPSDVERSHVDLYIGTSLAKQAARPHRIIELAVLVAP